MVEIKDEGSSVANKNRASVSDESIAIIRSWLQTQSHLPDQDVDDSLVARFIHCSDNDLDKCKATMDHFFKLRAAAPEFFTNRDPFQANIRTVFEIIDIIPLPNLTEEGYKVFLFRLADPNPDRFNYLDYLRTFFLIADTRMKTEKEFPTGEVPILDMSGFTLRHLTKINFSALRKQMQYVQEAHPVKLKQVHVINTLPILERIMTLFKPLIKKEVASMLHFHVPNSNTLEKFIPKCYLPNEYGGKAGPLKQLKQHWINKAESERDWLVSNPWCARNSSSSSQTKHDENTNVHTTINEEEKVGQGSFRSLSID